MVSKITLPMLLALGTLSAAPAQAQLTWSLAGGSEGWPAWARDAVTNSMNEAVAVHNQHGFFAKHVTANYNPGVPTAQANYDGWIDFGGQYNTRTAIHELAHALGTGTYWAFDGGTWDVNSAAGKLVKLFDGQGAVLSTGGSHFWPYGLNYDTEDGPAARERHCKLVAAFRFDMGIVVDSDRDGLPDDWERLHFAGLDAPADGDPDGDGISNADEFGSDADPNVACPVRDGKVYVIRSQLSGRAITAADAALAEGSRLALHEPDGSVVQQWTARYAGQGFFRFSPVGSERVVQTPGTDTASGRALELAAATSAFQQQWRVVTGPGAEAGHYQISNRETARVADGLDAVEGAPVQQYPFLGNIPQQFWAFQEVTADLPGVDAEVDGGSAQDAGFGSAQDAGVGTDGGAASGVTAQDSGLPVDGGIRTGSDAQVVADAGEPDDDAQRSGGCSVGRARAGTDAAPWYGAVLMGVLFAWRRRRRS